MCFCTQVLSPEECAARETIYWRHYVGQVEIEALCMVRDAVSTEELQYVTTQAFLRLDRHDSAARYPIAPVRKG